MANLNDTIADGTAKFKVVKSATNTDLDDLKNNGVVLQNKAASTNNTYPILLGATADATSNIGSKATQFSPNAKVRAGDGAIFTSYVKQIIDNPNGTNQDNLLQHSGYIDIETAPEKTTYNSLVSILDKNSHYASTLQFCNSTSGLNTTYITARKFINNEYKISAIYANIENDGTPSASITTSPSFGDCSSKIATTNYVVTNNAVKPRMSSTNYSVREIVSFPSSHGGKNLVCVKAGKTSDQEIMLASANEARLCYDGTVVWMIDSYAKSHMNAAGYHNGTYRGANITEYYESGLMSDNIRAGNFVGMYIGDYINKDVTTSATVYTPKGATDPITTTPVTWPCWEVAGFDYFYKTNFATNDSIAGDTHHVILHAANSRSPIQYFTPIIDNGNSTEGGYVNSDFYKYGIPIINNALETTFGTDHILEHYEFLTNSFDETLNSGRYFNNPGATNSAVVVKLKANIPNENMTAGSSVWGSSGYEVGTCASQLPLYALRTNINNNYEGHYLRTIVGKNRYTFFSGAGDVNIALTQTNHCAVKPYFCFY